MILDVLRRTAKNFSKQKRASVTDNARRVRYDGSVLPFWRSSVMERESVLFLPREDGADVARLLFQPETISSITDVAGQRLYAEGDDYTIDLSLRAIVRGGRANIPRAIPPDGELTHSQLCVVTYTHREEWYGIVPAFAGEQLPRTLERLRTRQPLTVCLTGDSISEGYDTSGFHNLPPYQPAFGSIVAASLSKHYGSDVQLRNLATAGWTAEHAVWDVERIAAARPDLVIVAYGMNDAADAEPGEFLRHVVTTVSAIRERQPQAEFVLVSPMLPTPECTWVVHSRFDEYRQALATLSGPGIAVADLTGMWRDMMVRKDARELSGNWLNHPNDFGHRVYAQVIGALLVPAG
jgi:lysophospholipase L1-like esterase